MDLETLAIRYQTQGEAQVKASLEGISTAAAGTTESLGAAAGASDALAASTARSTSAMGAHGFQIGRLRQDLGSLIGRLTGTNMAVDRVAAAFGAMAIGNLGIIAVLGGIAALVYGYEKLSLSLKGVTADQEKAIEAIQKAQHLKDVGGEKGEADTGLLSEIAKAQEKIDGLKAQMADVRKAASAPGQAAGMGTEEITELQAKIDALQKPLDEKVQMWSRNRADINKEQAKEQESNLQHYASNLAELVQSNVATDAQRKQALAMEKNYFAAAKLLAQQGNVELAAEYEKLGTLLKGAFTKSEKQPKKQFPGLKDALENAKAEAAAMKETHDLQVRLEQDSEDATAQKYAKIRALDEAYLVQVGSLYGFESAEYQAMLKEMEQHHKSYLADKLKDENQYKNDVVKMQADMDRQETERQKKLKEESLVLSRDVAKGMGDIAKAAFATGGGAGAAAKAFEDMILGTIGNVLVKQGEVYLAQSTVMIALSAFLSNPFTAGPAALGIGLALIAIGEGLGAIASGGGRGGGGAGSGPVGAPHPVNFNGSLSVGGNSATTAGTLTPVVPVGVTIIGPNDPTAQRQIVQLITNAQRRNVG